MTDITPVGSPRIPVDRMARLLLVYARQDPALLARSRNQRPDDSRDQPFDLPALFHSRPDLARSDEGFSGELYLEELVCLASEAAERAGAASRQAVDATGALRRGRLAFAALGGLGMVVGLAAAAGSLWNSAERQARVADELAAVQTLQQRADRQLVAVVAAQGHPAAPVQAAGAAPPTVALAPPTADAPSQPVAPPPPTADAASQAVAPAPPPAAAALQSPPNAALETAAADAKTLAIAAQSAAITPSPRLRTINVATRQEWSAIPVDVPQSEAHPRVSAPPVPVWAHRHHRPVRRVYRYYPAGRYYPASRYYPAGRYYQVRPPVVFVRVVQNIQRDIGSLFR